MLRTESGCTMAKPPETEEPSASAIEYYPVLKSLLTEERFAATTLLDDLDQPGLQLFN